MELSPVMSACLIPSSDPDTDYDLLHLLRRRLAVFTVSSDNIDYLFLYALVRFMNYGPCLSLLSLAMFPWIEVALSYYKSPARLVVSYFRHENHLTLSIYTYFSISITAFLSMSMADNRYIGVYTSV